MNEINHIVVLYSLTLDLHLELVVRHQLKDTLGNVLVDDQVTTSRQHYLSTTAFTDIFDPLLLFPLLDGHLDTRRVDGKGRIVPT